MAALGFREVGVTEDPGTRGLVGEDPEQTPQSAHDDIVKRLLDYQRHLRDETTEVAESEPSSGKEEAAREATAAPTSVAVETPVPTVTEVVIPESEGPMETTGSIQTETQVNTDGPSSEPAEARSELPTATAAAALELLAELRTRFQDLAIEADERLSTLEAFLKDSAGQAEV
jgi:hypothetical protein